MWNLGPFSTTNMSRSIGRLKRRWEDDLYEFIKIEETEKSKGSDLRNNDSWIRIAKIKNKNGKKPRKNTQPTSSQNK